MRDGKLLQKNIGLKNVFSNRRCFVLATGPSIKRQDLSKLSGEISISVSNFFVHPDFKIIKPFFHVFTPSHPPITEDQFGEMFKDAEKHFPENQNVMISLSDKHIVERYQVFKKQNVYYYYLGIKPIDKKIDFTKDLPEIQTVPHVAIYLAIYLGVKEINLLGVDHDWILHVGESRHFFEEKESVLSQKGYNEWSESDFGTECASYASLWDKYRSIRSFAKKEHISITNATDGGLLDLFPRKNLDDILGITKNNEK